MNRFLSLLLVFVIGLSTLTSAQAQNKAAEQRAVLAVINANTRALQTENLSAYMKTIDPRAPGYSTTQQPLQRLFAAYDVRYQINSLRVSAFTKDVAQVTFDQSSFKVRGPAFQNNRIIGVHTLRKYRGAWKLFSTRADKIMKLK